MNILIVNSFYYPRRLAERYSNIVITGYVESVDEYYDLCDCMIVPLFIGSGQRVKLIEGFSKGMPSVSTSVGAEGLDVRDKDNVLLADTCDSFAEAIIKLQDKKMEDTHNHSDWRSGSW